MEKKDRTNFVGIHTKQGYEAKVDLTFYLKIFFLFWLKFNFLSLIFYFYKTLFRELNIKIKVEGEQYRITIHY